MARKDSLHKKKAAPHRHISKMIHTDDVTIVSLGEASIEPNMKPLNDFQNETNKNLAFKLATFFRIMLQLANNNSIGNVDS